MAYLNANIPVTYAQIRREYLYDLKKHHGEVEDLLLTLHILKVIYLTLIIQRYRTSTSALT